MERVLAAHGRKRLPLSIPDGATGFDLLSKDVVRLIDRRQLIETAGQADEGEIELGEIVPQVRSGVALGINGDEDDADPLRIPAQGVHDITEDAERGRADIRVVRIAEIEEDDLPALLTQRERLALLVGETEVRCR